MLLVPALFFLSCDGGSSSDDDDDDNDNLIETPEADPEDDDQGTGIYKGIIADGESDTSGNYKIEITDEVASGKTVSGPGTYKVILTLEIDGTTLTAEGTAVYDGTTFTVSITIEILGHTFGFGVDISSDGVVDDSSLTVTMDGEEIYAVIEKETSTGLVESWEGTFSGNAYGIWNFIIQESDMGGVFSESGGEYGEYTGSVNDNAIIFSGDASGTGTISGYGVTGVWNFEDLSGSWEGSRTQ